MRRVLRLTVVSAPALASLVMVPASVGAATSGGNYTLIANGGFVALSALNRLGLTGAGSAAIATNGQVGASGTGLCATDAEGSAASCQTASSNVSNTTANAAATDAAPNATAGPTCLLPTLSAACGTATSSQSPSGGQTAKGVGSLGQLTVGLGSLVSPTTRSGLPLCGTARSPGDALTSSLGGLLGSVNTLLSSSGLPALASSASSPLSSVCAILSGLTSELGGLGGVLSDLTASTDLLTIKPGQATSTIDTAPTTSGDSLETATATTEGVEGSLPQPGRRSPPRPRRPRPSPVSRPCTPGNSGPAHGRSCWPRPWLWRDSP